MFGCQTSGFQTFTVQFFDYHSFFPELPKIYHGIYHSLALLNTVENNEFHSSSVICDNIKITSVIL